MCGRFTLHTPVEDLVERFSLPTLDFEYPPNYNVAPTQAVFTILPAGLGRKAALLTWGLKPPWQKKGARPLINARLETLTEKPTFRGLVNSRRCLVIADGFYEWKTEGDRKHPVYITLDGGKPFAFAGLWDNPAQPSCTLITQEACSRIQPIHHRMPLILTPETEELWLSSLPFADVVQQLPDQEARSFAYYPVSTLVNSPRNNDPGCLVPLEE